MSDLLGFKQSRGFHLLSSFWGADHVKVIRDWIFFAACIVSGRQKNVIADFMIICLTEKCFVGNILRRFCWRVYILHLFRSSFCTDCDGNCKVS